MNRLIHFVVHLLAVVVFVTAFPVVVFSSNAVEEAFQSSSKQSTKKRNTSGKSSSNKTSQKRTTPKKKSTSPKTTTSTRAKQPAKKSSASASKQAAQAKAYFDRGKKKLQAKDYAGALKDFQRSDKLRPSKTSKSYIAKLQAYLKKQSAAAERKGKPSSDTGGKPTPVPSQTKSVYQVSDNIYAMTHELDGLIHRMRRAEEALKPVESRSAERVDTDRLKKVEKRASEEPESRHAQRELALEYEHSGAYPKARDIYLRMIADDPMNADNHYYLGSLYSRMGQNQRSRFAYEEALEINPNHQATLNALSLFSDGSAGGEMARDLIKKASDREPEGPARLLNDVKEYLKSGELDEAAALSQDARDRYPDNAVFPYLEGKAHEAMGSLEQAKKSYKLSMTLDRTDPSPVAALGDVYSNQGNYLYAAVTYENALAMNPMDVNLRFKQGFSYLKAFEWGKAASAWEDLLHYAPNHQEVRKLLPQVYYVLSLEYNRNGFTDLGRRSFANALSVNPNSGEWIGGALKTAGEYYRENGLYRSALTAYQDAIELNPGDAGSYNGLGVTYWHMGEKEMAVAAWKKSLSLQPEDNSARGWLILATRRQGS